MTAEKRLCGGRAFTAAERRAMLALAAQGLAVGKIARSLQRSERSVWNWLHGPGALAAEAPRSTRAGQVTCLRCRREFHSVDRTKNRVCMPCKRSPEWESP